MFYMNKDLFIIIYDHTRIIGRSYREKLTTNISCSNFATIMGDTVNCFRMPVRFRNPTTLANSFRDLAKLVNGFMNPANSDLEPCRR